MEEIQHESGMMFCAYQADIQYPRQKQFDCGNSVINKFVQESLKRNVRDGNCAARAAIDSATGELLGVCTYTAYSLEKSRLAGVIKGSLPGEVGTIRLVMLGVAKKEQKKGYGLDLLCDFFAQVKIIHQALPVKGVYLDADPQAMGFYARLGFVQLNEPPSMFGAVPMFLGIQHILTA